MRKRSIPEKFCSKIIEMNDRITIFVASLYETNPLSIMIDQFTTWFTSLDGLMQVFWSCALVASVIFIIQMILTVLGMDSADVDVDFDVSDFGSVDSDTMDLGGGLSLFSIRNLINFLVGFGWGGICFRDTISNNFLLTVVAVIVGIVFVLIFFWVKKQAYKLQSNGAFDIKKCEGKMANVYLRIPGHDEGKGKIQISVGGSIHEIDAFTLGDPIPSGKRVKILKVTDNGTLEVEAV